MTTKEALENIKNSLADYREYAIDCLPNKAKRIREENNDDFKIVESALNRLEELEKVLSFVKEHTLLDGSVLRANFQWNLDVEENGKLLKECFK